MDLALNDDQIELQETARRYASARFADSPRPEDATWAEIAELGWLGLAVPEELGGVGATPFDTAVVFEELGRVAASPLLFDTGVLAPHVLLAVGTDWAIELAAALVDGTARAAVVISHLFGALPSDRVTAAIVTGSVNDRRLNGTAPAVADADLATHLVVLASTGDGSNGDADDGGVFCAAIDTAARGLSIEPRHGFVPDHFSIGLADVAVPDTAAVAPAGAVRSAILAATPLLCAYQVGSAQQAFEMSVDYSRERVQFGKPIGTFQRVQDHIIDLVNNLDSARWANNHALWANSSRDDAMAVHVAKAVTAQAHIDACTSAHEVHAGIGADLQYGLARHTFASRSLYTRLGDPSWHRRAIAAQLRERVGA
jgi:alkylation response protein AidB-like acyl-CoA dehydrogenase